MAPTRLRDYNRLVALITVQDIAQCPDFEQFYRLARRLSGLTIVLCDLRGRAVKFLGPRVRFSGFCSAIQKFPGVKARCVRCDQEHMAEAVRTGRLVRYDCHLGLTEFTIPVSVEGEIIGLLQCGQVLGRRPDAAAWSAVRRRLATITPTPRGLRRLFFRTRVIGPEVQDDLAALLELLANYIATARSHLKLQQFSPGRQIVLRAQSFIRRNLSQPLTLAAVARSAFTSRRNLARHFRKETGQAVVEYVHQVRIARARELLTSSSRPILEIALDCGFGSVKQFHRIFRRLHRCSPGQWRNQEKKTGS